MYLKLLHVTNSNALIVMVMLSEVHHFQVFLNENPYT